VKVAVTLDKETVADLDQWVREGRYPNRSRAMQRAVDLLAEREKRSRLVRELAKLDLTEERRMAEEGLGDSLWPASYSSLAAPGRRGRSSPKTTAAP